MMKWMTTIVIIGIIFTLASCGSAHRHKVDFAFLAGNSELESDGSSESLKRVLQSLWLTHQIGISAPALKSGKAYKAPYDPKIIENLKSSREIAMLAYYCSGLQNMNSETEQYWEVCFSVILRCINDLGRRPHEDAGQWLKFLDRHFHNSAMLTVEIEMAMDSRKRLIDQGTP